MGDCVYVCLGVQELGDALMEMKRAIEDVRKSKTLKQVLGTLLSIGNFLNGTQVSWSLSVSPGLE